MSIVVVKVDEVGEVGEVIGAKSIEVERGAARSGRKCDSTGGVTHPVTLKRHETTTESSNR
jgi:hypothetical protein